jgi:hypothetical protein
MAMNADVFFVHRMGTALEAVRGEAKPGRPGSEIEARVQEGFPRNLGDPVIDQLKVALRHGAV